MAQLLKNPSAMHLGLISGLGRSPGEGKGYPFQYSGLENSMHCIVHGVAKSQTRLSDFHDMHIQKWRHLPWSGDTVFGPLMSKGYLWNTCACPVLESVVSTSLSRLEFRLVPADSKFPENNSVKHRVV